MTKAELVQIVADQDTLIKNLRDEIKERKEECINSERKKIEEKRQAEKYETNLNYAVKTFEEIKQAILLFDIMTTKENRFITTYVPENKLEDDDPLVRFVAYIYYLCEYPINRGKL